MRMENELTFDQVQRQLEGLGRERADVVLSLIPIAPTGTLPDIVCLALGFYHHPQQDALFIALAERLKNETELVQRQALIALRSMDVLSDLGSAAEFVTLLVPHLAPSVLPWCMETALRAGSPLSRVPLLLALCQRICPEKIPDFVLHLLNEFAAQQENQDGAWFWDEQTLLGLARGVPVDLRNEVLQSVRLLNNRAMRANVLLQLGATWGGEALVELAPEALAAWRNRGEDTVNFVDDLRRLVEELPFPWRDQWREQLASEVLQTELRSDNYSQREERNTFWPLLTPEEQIEDVRRSLETARQAPDLAVKPEGDVFEGVSFSPRLEALEGLPAVPAELVDDVLEVVRSLAGTTAQLQALEHFVLLGPETSPAPLFVEAMFELISSMPPSSAVASTLTRLVYNTQAELCERAARAALDVIRQLDATGTSSAFGLTPENSSEQGDVQNEFENGIGKSFAPESPRGKELRELTFYAPSTLIPDIVQTILEVPNAAERRTLILNEMRHLASKWPESVLVLLPAVEEDEEVANSLTASWEFLSDEVRRNVNPYLWRTVLRTIALLRRGVTDEEQRDRLEGVVTNTFKCLWSEQQTEVLTNLLELREPLGLLLSVIQYLPSEWQSHVARQALQSEVPPSDWQWGDRASLGISLFPYLESDEQQNFVQEQFEEIRTEAGRRSSLLEHETSDEVGREADEGESDEQNDESEPGRLSFWSDTFHTLRRLLSYANETQLRDIIAWMRQLPTTAREIQNDELLTQGSLWIKEQVLALALITLARRVNGTAQVQVLLEEALDLAFYYPYYPEMGGNGAEPEPQGVELTVAQVRDSLNQLDADGQKILVGHLMNMIAERDVGDLVAVAREAVRRAEGDAATEISQNATFVHPTARPVLPLTPAPTTPGLYLQGQMPTQAQVGEVVTVRMRLAPQQGELSAQLREIALSVERACITLLLHAPGFDAISSHLQEVEIDTSNTSPWVGFELRSSERGRHPVTVSAFHEGTHLGELTATIEVVESVTQTFEQQPEANLESRAITPGEMTWHIGFDEKERRFQFSFFAPGGGNWKGCSEMVAAALSTLTERLIEGIEEVQNSEEPPGMRRDLLAGLGADLWSECLPTELQEVLTQGSDGVRRLQIISRGEAIPWEILCSPESGSESPVFLAERFPVYRWVMDNEAPNCLTWQKPSFVLIDPAEPSMETELNTVRRRMNAFREEAVPLLRSSEQLMEHLKRGEFDWLHFIGHHAFSSENPALSGMRIGKHFFRVAYLGTLKNRWRAHKPLIFLNACRTAGAAPLYTDVSGWASRCIAAGAGAFVGTLWEVLNHPAHQFADTFYEALSHEQPLADAFFQARLATRDAYPEDFSWLSYVLYGNADATVLTTSS